MKLVQFGAGKVGRSFLAQLFARAGYEVVFVDIDEALVEALNRAGRYRVVVKRSGAPDEILTVDHVRAVRAAEMEVVAEEVATCDVAATSVGKSALPHLFPLLARGLVERRKAAAQPAADRNPLDIIIAENIRGGAALFRDGLFEHLPAGFPFDEEVGLVETSIGKMVPLMTEEDLRTDPLWVFAESYNTLIVDRSGFRSQVPQVAGIEAVDNIQAYVDRKLFIHNLGHAATAYLGFAWDPSFTFIWEPLTVRSVTDAVTAAMREAAAALAREYPKDLTPESLEEHIQELLRRFANRSLGDTLFRVGRDLPRKLHRDDRLIGACLLAARHGLPFRAIARVVRAAVGFRAADERGLMFPADRSFASREAPRGLEHILTAVCRLDPAVALERSVMNEILAESD